MSGYLFRNAQYSQPSQAQRSFAGGAGSSKNGVSMAGMAGASRWPDALRDFDETPSLFGATDHPTTSGVPKLPDNHLSSSSKPQDPLANACIGIADVIMKMAITHPCTVLRRQCQVHQFARSLHLTPFTLVPVVCNMITGEGFLTLWKGAIGSGVLYAMSAASEILIADIFGLPRTVVPDGSAEKYWRHITLKASTYLAMTPFIVSSFIESVRSETGLGGDDIHVMDVVTNGFNRLRFDFFGPRDNSKRFSLGFLALPTVFYHTAHYFIVNWSYEWLFTIAKRYVNKKPQSERTLFHHYLPQVFAAMTSQVAADFACYPVETVLHRLYIQGTRTLIDNLDNGVSAISITAKYAGFVDCLKSIIDREGFLALYSGVGALALQYLLHFSFLRLIRWLFEYGTRALSNNGTARITRAPSAPLMESICGRNAAPASYPLQQMSPPSLSPYPTFGQTTATAFDRSSPPLFSSPTQPSAFSSRPLGPLFLSLDDQSRNHVDYNKRD